jgi:hypothetical protein
MLKRSYGQKIGYLCLIVTGSLYDPRMAEAQEATTEFTQVTQSPPFLNCRGRVTVSGHQGTVLMKGTVWIRDAAYNVVATNTSGSYSPNNPLTVETEYGTSDSDIPGSWSCVFSADVVFDYGDPVNIGSASQDNVCPGERGALVEEYRAGQVALNPGCTDFVQSVPGPSHYSFPQWNSGTYGWALLEGSVISNTYCVVSNLGSTPTLTSGYRNPAHNAIIGGAQNSRHVYGDAVDLDTPTAPNDTLYNSLRAIAKSGACSVACVEPRNISPSHYHGDYRGGCPTGW